MASIIQLIDVLTCQGLVEEAALRLATQLVQQCPQIVAKCNVRLDSKVSLLVVGDRLDKLVVVEEAD